MEQTGSRRVALSELLSPAAMKMRLNGKTRDAVLAELVGQIAEIGNRPKDQENLLFALKEREMLHSTGIGDGVALPHARNALVGLVDHPIVVFGRSDMGVPFDSVDGIPARIFFLLIAPTVNQHLAVLARLSRILRNAQLRAALLAAETPQQVIKTIYDAESQM